jgi:aspartate aminotransferase-like enzyme
MEASLVNLRRRGDRLAILGYGYFAERFVTLAERA